MGFNSLSAEALLQVMTWHGRACATWRHAFQGSQAVMAWHLPVPLIHLNHTAAVAAARVASC